MKSPSSKLGILISFFFRKNERPKFILHENSSMKVQYKNMAKRIPPYRQFRTGA
jgi:hypothetical protein